MTQRRIREAGHRVLVIDDTAHLDHYYADVVLNQNLNTEQLRYLCEPYTRLLLGTCYALLRSEFLAWRDWEREMEDVQCHICRRSEIEPVIQIERDDGELKVSICTGCGLVLLSPRWEREKYDLYYTSEYDQQYGFELPAPPHLASKAERIVERLEISVPNFVPNNVLDVGSGAGYVLAEFGRRQPNAALFAVETSPECAKFIADSYGAKVIARYVEEEWEASYQGLFDVIVMRHVLEHLLDPVGALVKLRTSMDPQGVLYVAVPNTMKARRFISPKGAFRIPHVYYYSMDTLIRTAAVAGFQPVKEGTHGSEIWAVLRKGSAPRAYHSVYRKQKALLSKVIELERQGIDPAELIQGRFGRKLKRLIPIPIRRTLRRLLQRFA